MGYTHYLSIPLWSDFIFSGLHTLPSCIFLSIPLWSDFIHTPQLYMQRTGHTFNPTMVWFYLYKFHTHTFFFFSPFNPTMVWFYRLTGGLWRTLRHFSFNPTMVWFYLPHTLHKMRKLIAFNPTMVWFYRILSAISPHIDVDFQSHYGLILSTIYYRKHRLQYDLSIPLWSDFIFCYDPPGAECWWAFNPTMVWFYLFRLIITINHDFILSIPLWSDFIS